MIHHRLTFRLLACWFALIPLVVFGQQLTSYEYWFDNDIGSRVSKSINGSEATINASINTQHLSDGLHTLNLRAKQSDNMYSAVTSSVFFKHNASEGNKMEYWFDDKIDNRATIDLPSSATEELTEFSLNLQDNTDFPMGLHKLNIRVSTEGKSLGAIYSSNVLKITSGDADIVEYWVDGDFANRKTVSGHPSTSGDHDYVFVDPFDLQGVPAGLHRIYYRATSANGITNSAVNMATVMIRAGASSYLEYWIDDDRSNVHTISGKQSADRDGYIFINDLDLGDVSPGHHRLYCRAVSSSGKTASAVTMTPIIVKSKYYHENKMIQYTVAVDEEDPVTYPIKNSAEEVVLTHTIDAGKLPNGKHHVNMSFWNSSYNCVTDTFSFIANTSGHKLATPDPSSFEATDITPSGFKASWDEVEGALYYDILVKQEGGDYEHPDYRGGTMGTSVNVTGLESFTPYYFQIRARNDNRNEASDWSPSVPNAVKTARIPTTSANLAIHSIKGFDGSEPLTKGHSYHYKVWVVNNDNSVWDGSFYLKDGNDDIKGWYQVSIPKAAAHLLECDYIPESAGSKDLILYYQTNGRGGGIPVNMSDNTPNKIVVQVVEEPTFYEGIKLSKVISCPTTSQLGNMVELSASVTNRGSDDWRGTLYLVDNGITLSDKTLTLKPGKSTVMTGTWTPETIGIHEIAVYYKTEKGYYWQLVSGNGYNNPVSVEVTGSDALNNATYANITHITKDVVPSEVTVGSVVYYYFRMTDDEGNRLKGIRIRFERTGSISTVKDIIETTPSDENGIAVLEIKTEEDAAIGIRGETVTMVCKALLNENNDNVLFAYQPSDGEIKLSIHQGTNASIESGFENVEKMKFTLDLGVSAKASLGNYVKAKGSVSFPLSLSMKFDDNGEFKDYTYDSKIKASVGGSVGNYEDEYYSQNFGTSSTVIQGSVGVSGGFHYNFSSSDWRDIFVRFVMAWCDTYFKVHDWKKDLAIKTLESWYESKRDWKETTNWFIGGEIGASVDYLNVVEIPSFVQRSNKMPLMSFPDLGLGGNVSFNLDCKIKKEDTNRMLLGDGVSYKMKGEFKAQEKVRNLFGDAKLWWYTNVKHSFLNQLNNFYLDSPTQNLSCAFSVKSEELYDESSGKLKEVSHEMSLEDSWELSFNKLQIPWNPIDADEAKIGVTSTSTSKFVSKEDWATFVGDIIKSAPESQEAKYVYSLYPNLKFTTLFTTPGEIYSFWKRPPEGALSKLISKASDPSKFKLKDALKIEQTLSSDLTMAVKIPIFDWKALKFSMDVGATFGLYNKPTVSYYSVEDRSFFPLSIHPTTSIYRITGWLLSELAEKLGSIFDNDEKEIVNYIPMDDAYGTGLVLGTNTLLIVPGLPQYDESIDPSYPYFLDDDEQDMDAAGGAGSEVGNSIMAHRNCSNSQGLTHYRLDNFDNNYAKYVIRRHPRLGERIQKDICTFAFNFNDGTQNFDEGVIIKIPHYYPAGDLFAITDEGDTLFVVSEVCNVIAQNGDSVFSQTQQGEFEITGKVGVDDLIPFGFPENQSLGVYYCADDSEIWQYVGPAGTSLKVDKLGAYMMATSIKNDLETPQITATLNENTGLMHINVTDNIGVKVSSLQVFVNGDQKQVEMINESSYELELSMEEMLDTIAVNIIVRDLADNEGSLSQIFNVTPRIHLGDVNGDGVVNITDISLIVAHILGETLPVFIKQNADMNNDKSINVTDVTSVVGIVLNELAPKAPANARYDMDDRVVLAGNSSGCSICLDGNAPFTACEMTLTLPEGCTLLDASLDSHQPTSHQVAVHSIGDGRYRLVVYAPADGRSRLGEGVLVNLGLNGRPDGIKVSDIMFSNRQYETVVLQDAVGMTTGLDGVLSTDAADDTYSIQGIKTTTPRKGVYIKGHKKKVVKH